MSAYSLQLLGEFCLSYSGNRISLPPQQSKLVAALALSKNGSLQRHVLASYFWPLNSDDVALRRLRIVLSKLKNIVEKCHCLNFDALIKASYSSVQLCDIKCDYLNLVKFDENIENEEYYRILKNFIDGISPHLLPHWEYEWLDCDRNIAQEKYRSCVLQLMTYLFLNKEYSETIRLGHVLMNMDPCDEAAAQILMEALTRCGRRAQAIGLFKDLSYHLRSDYGIAPSSSLKQKANLISLAASSVPCWPPR